MGSAERKIENVVVAVCGGAGYLSSHLVNYLIDERNCTVIVLDNLISGQKKWIHPKAKFIWCDITQSESFLYKVFKENAVEYIFNYAAIPFVPISFKRPVHVANTNFMGALFVLNAGQDAGVKGILQVSSAEIYGDATGKIDENYPATPHSTYGVSKLAIDMEIQARWKEAKTPAIALRQFNCIGERSTFAYVIPEIIRQVAELKKTGGANLYLGNNSTRDFQYAGDAVRMAVELLEKGNFGEVYNMGSEEAITIYELAVKIAQLMDVKLDMIWTDPKKVRPKELEIWHLQANNTKLYSVIDYRPKTPLEEALKLTIKDYEENGFCF